MLIAVLAPRLLNAAHQVPDFYFFVTFSNRNFHSWSLLRREALYAGAAMLSCQLLRLGEIWEEERKEALQGFLMSACSDRMREWL